MALKTEFLKYRDNETGVEQLYEVIPPAPTETDRGGIIASPKTAEDTVEAKLGADGKLYVPEGTKDYEELKNKPTSMVNPFKIIFKGLFNKIYDGSEEVEIEIPSSWNDLEDKPFGEEILNGFDYTFDGNLSNRQILNCTIDGRTEQCIKIANIVPTEEQLQSMTFTVVNEDEDLIRNYEYESYAFDIEDGYIYRRYQVPTNSNWHAVACLIIVQTDKAAVDLGLYETGIYHTSLMDAVDNKLFDYISELHISGECENIVQIQEKYIPGTIARTHYVDNNFVLKSDFENSPRIIYIPSEEHPLNSYEEFIGLPNGFYYLDGVYDFVINENQSATVSGFCNIKDGRIFCYDNGICIGNLFIQDDCLYAEYCWSLDGFGYYDAWRVLGNYHNDVFLNTEATNIIDAINELNEEKASVEYVDEQLANLDIDVDLTEYETKEDAGAKLAEAKEYAMSKVNPEGTGSLSLNRKADTVVGDSSVAAGVQATASAQAAISLGLLTTASATGSMAEGYSTTAAAVGAHAEGVSTTAAGSPSHAEGSGTQAIGNMSHTEGSGTIALTRSQHVQGEYNIIDSGGQTSRGTYAHIVGNGTSESARSNAHTIDWDGNAWFAGNVTVGSSKIPLATMGDVSSKVSYSEYNTAMNNKANKDHNHDSVYETKTDAANKLVEAKQYTDEAVANIIASDPSDAKINAHNTSTESHSDIRALLTELNEKITNFLDVDDTTTDQLSEVLTLINNNKGTLESLTTSKVNKSDIIDNLTTSLTDKVLSANQGVVIKEAIDSLDAELDEKSDKNHNHNDIYFTKTEIENMEFIALDDIDEICGTSIQMAREVAL